MSKLDFTPSVKTVEKMKMIAYIRGQGKKWDDIFPIIGHKKRYVQELYRFYMNEMKGGKK